MSDRERSYHTWKRLHLLVAADMELTASSWAPSPTAGRVERRVTQGFPCFHPEVASSLLLIVASTGHKTLANCQRLEYEREQVIT